MGKYSAFILIIVGVILSSCMRVPSEELSLYSSAFDKARIAGDAVLDEVVSSGAFGVGPSAGDPCAVDPSLGYRPCFDPDMALGEEALRKSEPIDIRVRRTALRSIMTYNILLSELVEGRSVSEVGVRIDKFKRLLDISANLVPNTVGLAVVPAVASFKALALKLEATRANTAAVQSLQSAAPDIRNLIRFMIADTSALYKIYVVRAKGNLGDLKIALKRAELTGQSAEAARLRTQISSLGSTKTGTAKARDFEKVLISYVRLLNKTESAMDFLLKSVGNSGGTTLDSAEDFIRITTEIRILSDRFLNEVRALK